VTPVLHLACAPTYRGGERQVALLAGLQAATRPVSALVGNARLRGELIGAGVRGEPWGGPTASGLLRLRGALREHHGVVAVHDSRSLSAIRLLGPLRHPVVVHRRIDDRPRDRAATRRKYGGLTVVCVSEAVARVMAEWGHDPARLHVVRSALPDRGPAPPPPGPFSLLSVGALVPHKGHDVLLAALRLLPPIPTVIAGVGPARRRLGRLAGGLPVQFVGDVPDPSRLFASAHAVVHPSRTEGLGTAVLEGQLAGRPIIASAVGGLPELLGPGDLVAADDPRALAAAIERLRHASAPERARLGAEQRRRALAWSSPAALLAATDAVYAAAPWPSTTKTAASSRASSPAGTVAPAPAAPTTTRSAPGSC